MSRYVRRYCVRVQNGETTAQQFVQAIRLRYDGFREAAQLISNFVKDAGSSVETFIQKFLDFSKELREVEETDETVEDDMSTAESTQDTPEPPILTDEQARYLAEMVHKHAARLQRYPGMLFEMAFIYFVAAFEAYMQDVVELTLRYRPEILKSGKQLTVERIIELTQTGGLIEFLAEREVGELGYRSFREQADYYREKFKLEIAAMAEIEQLIEIHARRNLLVHNGGIINRRYLEAVPDTSGVVGQQLRISEEYWAETVEALSNVARHASEHLVRKYGPKLPRSTGA